MSYVQQYVELDGTKHAIAEDGGTFCGLPLPHGMPYGPLAEGEKAHCGPDDGPTVVVTNDIAFDGPAPKAKKRK